MKRNMLIGAGVVFWLSLCFFAYSRFEQAFFGSDETTTKDTSVRLLDGKVFLGLYNQHMWDAILWTVIATDSEPPTSLSAHNAVIKTTGIIVAGDADLGFQRPPVTLAATSDSTARFCFGRWCRTITCSAANACESRQDSIPNVN